MQLAQRKIKAAKGEILLQVDERAIHVIERLQARHSGQEFVSYRKLVQRLSDDYNTLRRKDATDQERSDAKAFEPTLMALYAFNSTERADKKISCLFSQEDEDLKAWVPSEFSARMPLGPEARDQLRALVVELLQESGHLGWVPLEASGGEAAPIQNPESQSLSAGSEDSSTP